MTGRSQAMRTWTGVLLIWCALTGSEAFAQQQDEVSYFLTDAVGSIRLVTDATGQVVEDLDYLPFGEPYPVQSATERRGFGGKELDQETKLDYFGARYYASQTGRFTTVDPVMDIDQALVDPQRWNRYIYVRNNPFRYVDPDGRAIESVWDVLNIGLGVGSFVSNVREGAYLSAVLDAAGVVVDSGAAVVPFIPGGAGSAIRGWRIAENAQLGRTFERAVFEALGAAKNTGGVSEIATRITTIPDLPNSSVFGVTEIKNVQNLSSSKQLQAQFAAAQTAGLPFNLIVSTRTGHVSERVRQAVAQTKGKIFVYDDKTRKFSEALFDEYGNVVR